ncbi:hypothetical protein CFC21_026978 [Triticum aestivum]|nr:wall-associated receptor kinase 2 [Aegilops tauschii subsp. strangulata]XP_044329572.1 wall-associated receptor kinase 2-like [Triticum aestivum]KAF7012826.1 hypothetical protein CFC21_026976 [Triticum aestivum]KAF7012827.1 hypothetical protein CFC21_026977 [Triticum aestivum]KAF7012828.1 hypothetical protein CFC21_026978 [Triticum aestivum]
MTIQYSSYVVTVTLLLLVVAAASSRQKLSMAAPTTLPGCPDKCGNVSIPYPFGTQDGCFLPGFQIICNHTFHPPRAFFPAEYFRSGPDMVYSKPLIRTEHVYYNNTQNGDDMPRGISSFSPVELMGVSVAEGKLQVRAPFCYKCKLNETHHSYRNTVLIYFPDRSPFFLSEQSTVLMGIGKYPITAEQRSGPSCQAYVQSLDQFVNGTCSGQGCCQATMLPQTHYDTVTMESHDHNDCTYAMLVDKSWYSFTSLDLDGDVFLRRNNASGVPVAVDFVITNHSCPRHGQQVPEGYACTGDNTICVQLPLDDDNEGYLCRCSQGYQGNPYIQNGCQDINECEKPDLYPCHGTCNNREGEYECACPAGTKGNAKEEQCTEMFPLPAKEAVGAIGCLFVMALVVFFLLLRRQKRKMKQLYMKNGGPALEKANNIKIYRREELKPILKSTNFIGKGCFGEVYKGYLDNRLVAVKKPVEGIVAHNEQFANEVIIQSQVIHKNIVRLIGCCLEVDIPMLVYEFLSKGSLDDILHSNSKVPLDLNVRLNIAAESAEGLAYMHSKTGKIILHGDVKPANILLDDDYAPKVSDFGISRMIARDKEHTTSVIGDRTYMDPVYLQTGLLTEKSDVYSFGVLLLELVSRRKATFSDHNSLVRNFVDAHKTEKIPIELFDKEFVEPGDLELLGCLARVAVECLNLDVDERPAMTDVAERLLMLKRSRK